MHKPYVAPEQSLPEFTWRGLVPGILLGIIFGAANAYLGLRAGLTISTSIPIAVMTVAVYAPGGFRVAEETWDADRIRATGASTKIDAFSQARYHFSQRQDVPDERLFNGVSAELHVEGVDDTGTATTAPTRVTVTRR